LLFFAAAAAVAIVTAVVVASDLAALHRRARELGPERTVVVARRDLPLGAVVGAADLRERRVHRSQSPPGMVSTVDAAVGRVVRVAVLRGGFVGDRNLAPRRRTGLDGAVPEGMRAIRVVVNDALRPRVGAAVDVLASFELAAEDADGSTAEAAVVARGVLVLAADEARTTEGAAALGITVLVTAREARALAFAATHGVLTIALVPPEEARAP
jgi:Flp pilus assembly protein CpaB